MKSLVIEDDAIGRKFLQKILLQYGECDVVVDGLEALDAYLISLKQKKPYDLVCLDIMMPKLDGVKVLRTIKELENHMEEDQRHHSKIVLVTALEDSHYVKQALEIGCDSFIAKPVNSEAFIENLKKLGLIE